MFAFGLVDDREKERESVKIALELELEDRNQDHIIVHDIGPFKAKEEYISWIQEQSISVLILDQRLNDGALVNYRGHELAEYVKKCFKDIPIYIVTSYPDSDELKETYKLYNLIIGRNQFSNDSKNLVNLFYNTGAKFYEDYNADLYRLSEISKKIAKGLADESDYKEALVIQEKLQIPTSMKYTNSRSHLLNDADAQLKECNRLIEEIKSYLSNKK